jgi:hypothetical protein
MCKRFLSLMLSLGLLTVSVPASTNADGIRNNITVLIEYVLVNPGVHHPYDIIGALVKQFRALLQYCRDAQLDALCSRLERAIAGGESAQNLLMMLGHAEMAVPHPTQEKLQKLSNVKRFTILSELSKRQKGPQEGVGCVEQKLLNSGC